MTGPALWLKMRTRLKFFNDVRYISTSEATWHIFGFDLHNNSLSVIRLQVHLPQEQSMVFNSQGEREDLEQLAEKGGTTTLTAWLEATVKYPKGWHLLYSKYVEQLVSRVRWLDAHVVRASKTLAKM